jgi:lysylphosphatidylglycerol synthetase-like protein (DUF2156 family)
MSMRLVGVRVFAALAAIVGMVDLVAATPRHLGHVCRGVAVFLLGQPLTRPQALILGLILLTVAHGVAGRRRLALHVAVGGLAVILAATVPGPPVRVVVLGALIMALIALRDQFGTRPDQRRLRLAAEVGLAVVAIVLLRGGWDLAVNREQPGTVGATVLAGLLADPVSHSAQAGLLAFLVTTGTVTVLLLAFAPAAPPGPGDPAQRRAVTALAAHADSGSLAPFATRSDKAYVFSPDRRAAIGYRVRYGVALVGGDPVGAADAADAAVAAFLRECEERGWRPAVLGAGGDLLPIWQRYGLHGLAIGDEAVVDVPAFSLASRRMRNVRQAVQRTHNAGVTVTLGPLDGDLAVALRPVLDDWLAGHEERGFAMNLDHILAPRPDCLLAVAYGATDRPEAFARFALCGDGRILTLDVAPRRADAPNGVVERLVVDVVAYAGEHGAREVSLNFAGLRRVFEVVGPFARFAGALGHTFDRWIQLGPLYRFCAKFHPRWHTRYLLLRSWLDVALVTAAALTAEFAGGSGPVPDPAPIPEAEGGEPAAGSATC